MKKKYIIGLVVLVLILIALSYTFYHVDFNNKQVAENKSTNVVEDNNGNDKDKKISKEEKKQIYLYEVNKSISIYQANREKINEQFSMTKGNEYLFVDGDWRAETSEVFSLIKYEEMKIKSMKINNLVPEEYQELNDRLISAYLKAFESEKKIIGDLSNVFNDEIMLEGVYELLDADEEVKNIESELKNIE